MRVDDLDPVATDESGQTTGGEQVDGIAQRQFVNPDRQGLKFTHERTAGTHGEVQLMAARDQFSGQIDNVTLTSAKTFS